MKEPQNRLTPQCGRKRFVSCAGTRTPSFLACHLRHVRPPPDQPLVVVVHVCQLAAARSLPPSALHLASPKTSVMLWSRKGVPGSKRSGEQGTPFLDASRRAKFRERAGSRVVSRGVALETNGLPT